MNTVVTIPCKISSRLGFYVELDTNTTEYTKTGDGCQSDVAIVSEYCGGFGGRAYILFGSWFVSDNNDNPFTPISISINALLGLFHCK